MRSIAPMQHLKQCYSYESIIIMSALYNGYEISCSRKYCSPPNYVIIPRDSSSIDCEEFLIDEHISHSFCAYFCISSIFAAADSKYVSIFLRTLHYNLTQKSFFEMEYFVVPLNSSIVIQFYSSLVSID